MNDAVHDGTHDGTHGDGAGAAAAADRTRHAIYFVPPVDGPLGRFGAAVLGRLPDGSEAPVAPGAPACRAARVARALPYGFHATLKAPFRLVAGATPASLEAAVRRLAASLATVELGELRLRHAGSATVLETRAPVPALDALAAAVVTGLDGFRAPLTDGERARRSVDDLDAAARARLERWGYPWVLDGFSFHLTLATGGSPNTPAEDVAWRAWLDAVRAATGPLEARLDRLSLCRQAFPGGSFVLAADAPLASPSPSP